MTKARENPEVAFIVIEFSMLARARATHQIMYSLELFENKSAFITF